MFQTNKKRYFSDYKFESTTDLVVPNLAVNVKAAVEKGMVSPLATQPTYGETELSESSIGAHYVDDPLDMLNAARIQAGKKVAADSVPHAGENDNPKIE